MSNLPRFVDLRSNYDRVYNQGTQSSCGPHALSACLDIIYERATGIPHRFDKQTIYENCHMYMNVWGDQYGVSAESIEYVSKTKGFLCHEPAYDSQYLKGFEFRKVTFYASAWDSWKELLASGVPIYVSIRAGSAFTSGMNNGIEWRKHRWGDSIFTAIDHQYTHAVALVGYDDDAQCWLFENSWGDNWGDGGFFGMPYNQMQWFLEGAWHFSVVPVKTYQVEGKDMTVRSLYSMQALDFVENSKSALRTMLMKEFENKGVQGLIDMCKFLSITDKHLELIAGWDRNTVRNFRVENPNVNWDGFKWEQL